MGQYGIICHTYKSLAGSKPYHHFALPRKGTQREQWIRGKEGRGRRVGEGKGQDSIHALFPTSSPSKYCCVMLTVTLTVI